MRENSEKERIYGGQPANIKDYPYQVFVHQKGHHESMSCGGAIVGKYYVLTAAHCLTSKDPKEYVVFSGNTYRKAGFHHKASLIIPHENYKLFDDGVRAENDVGLIKVIQPFEIEHNFYPVRKIEMFYPIDEAYPGTQAVLAGWGKKFGGSQADTLQSLVLPIVSKEQCNYAYSNMGGIPQNQICAGYLNHANINVCHGDSGSPLVIGGRVAGITSWVREPCGMINSPAVFTEVSQYRKWIDLHMVY